MKAWLLASAFLCCATGWACLAMAMEPHWQQARGDLTAPHRRTATLLRSIGAAALLGSLLLCLRADRASMAALVWVLMLTATALGVALVLSWCPRLLAPLALPWHRQDR